MIPEELKNVSDEIFVLIKGKNSTQYDFWAVCSKYKKISFFTVTSILTGEGHNILHEILDKGKLSFMNVLVQKGWWKILSQQKVPEDSPSEYKGKPPKYVAEIKRSKKPLEEFTKANEWENSLSPLMKAIRSGDAAKASQILNLSGEEIFYCDHNGGNALYWTVITGDKDFFVKLVDAGIDPGTRTKKNENLLHVTCSVGQYKMIETIVKKSNVDPLREDNYHKTPIDRVSENGDVNTLKELIKSGIQPPAGTPAITAFHGRMDFLQYCTETLQMNVDSRDIYDRTPLLRAAEGDKVNVVKYLMDKGANITLITCNKKNIIHVVAESGSIELMNFMMSILKEKGLLLQMINKQDRFSGVELCFLIRGRDKGRDAWHYVEVVRTKTPVFLKNTKSGNVEVTSYGEVLKSGWGINPDQDVMDDIEDMFKRRKLDVTAQPDMTPLHIALFKGHPKIVELLVENGADVNQVDQFGNTPLMLAASKGDAAIVNLLEKKGAISNVMNHDGKTAVDIADINEHGDIVNMLKGKEDNQSIEGFLSSNVPDLEQKLKRETLDSVRRHGGDVRRHIIDSLRDFRIDINQILIDIGSGPVLQSSE